MGQESYRFRPQFLGGSYYRVDLSWRTSEQDGAHFSEERTGALPEESDTSYTYYRVDKISMKARNEADLIAMDVIQLEITATSVVASALSVLNESTDVRLWFSPDGTTWEPVFWGRIDYKTVEIDTTRVVEGTYVKTCRFSAYDSLTILNKIPYGDETHMSDQFFVAQNTMRANAWCGATRMLDIEDPNGEPWATHVFTSDLIMLRYYLEEIPLVVFEEQRDHSSAYWVVKYGYTVTGVESIVTYDAFLTNDLLTTQHYSAGFMNAATMYKFGGWKLWNTWGDLLKMLCEQFGFGLTTEHNIDSGRWVRTAVYTRMDGANNRRVTMSGALISRMEKPGKQFYYGVNVTTQINQGAHAANAFVIGGDEEYKIATPFRTYGNVGPNDYNDIQTSAQKRADLFNVLFIQDNDAYRLVNNAIVDGKSYPGYTYSMWYPPHLAENGIAAAVGTAFRNHVLNRANKLVIKETYSRVAADDGSGLKMGNLKPYTMIDDREYTMNDFKITEIEIVPEKGECTITKELV